MSRRFLFAMALAAAVLLAVSAPVLGAKPQRGSGTVAPPPGESIHLNPADVAMQLSGNREELVDVNNESTISKDIRAFQEAKQPEERKQIINDLTDFCVQRGLRPSPDVAELLLAVGLQARDQGKVSEYSQDCRYAESFDPGHPVVHAALADAHKREKSMLSGAFIFEVLATVLRSVTNIETRWLALANLALWLRLASFLLLTALGIVLLAKYEGQLRHDVREWLGGSDTVLVRAAGFIALLLPSLLFLAGYWWVIYWVGLFMLYARWPERVVATFALVLFIGSGALALRFQQEIYLDLKQPQFSNLRCHAGRIGVGLDANLPGLAGTGDAVSRTSTFLLGSRYLLHGSYAKAEAVLQPLLAGGTEDAAVANNIGCIYFYENRFQEAIQRFTKAIALRPDSAVTFLNRSLAENKIFEFTEAKQDQDRARTLDRTLLASDKFHQTEEWSPLPIWLPLAATRALALQQEAAHPGSLTGPLRLSPSWVFFVFRPAFSLIAFLFWAIFLVVALAKTRGFFAHACLKCGRPFCARCKTSLEFESFCSQCVHLFIKQDGVSPEARMKKTYEVDRFNGVQRVQRAVFSLVAPGAGHFLDGRPVAALVLLGCWSGCVSALAFGLYALPFPYPLLADLSPLKTALTWLALLFLAVLWIGFGWPNALRREPPGLGRILRG